MTTHDVYAFMYGWISADLKRIARMNHWSADELRQEAVKSLRDAEKKLEEKIAQQRKAAGS